MTVSPAQAAARRRFMQEHAPMTDIPKSQATFVDPELVGRRLYHSALGVVLAYEYSMHASTGDVVHAGTVERVRPGLGIALGSHWAYWADRLQIILSKGECHAPHGGKEGSQP